MSISVTNPPAGLPCQTYTGNRKIMSKLGPHFLHNTPGIGAWRTAAPVSMKHYGTWGAALPGDGLTVGIRAQEPMPAKQFYEGGHSPEDSASVRFAHHRAGYLADEHIQVWEFDNELTFETQHGRQWYAAYTIANMQLFEAIGKKAAIFSFSVGTPELDHWPDYIPALRYARDHGHYLALHEYMSPTADLGVGWNQLSWQRHLRDNPGASFETWKANNPGEWCGRRHSNGTPDESYPHGWGVLRYRQLYDTILKPLGLDDLPLLLTEIGCDIISFTPSWWGHTGSWRANVPLWESWGIGDPDRHFADMLIWYDERLKEDSYVKGAHVFTVGHNPGSVWADWDIAGTAVEQHLFDHMEESEIPPPDPDPPGLYPGVARTDFARTAVLWHASQPVEFLTRTRVDTYAGGHRYSSMFSADDAGLGNWVDLHNQLRTLTTRRVIAVNPDLWGNDPHGSGHGLSGFFDLYYPGIDYLPITAVTPEEASDKVKAILDGQPPPPPPGFAFTHWPTNHRVVTQRFGANPDYYGQFGLPGHEGVDMQAPHSTPVYSVAPGTVSDIRESATGHNYGRFVRVAHTDGYETTYAHMHSIGVTLGQQVQGGQQLGLADNTGNSFGSHLHLTLKKPPGAPGWPHNIINPEPFMGHFANVTWPDPITPPPPPPPPAPGPARWGLHASADPGDIAHGPGGVAEFEEFKLLRPGVIKVLSAHAGVSIGRLHDDQVSIGNMNVHWVIRAFLNWGNRNITPQQFFNDTINDTQRATEVLRGRGVPWSRIHIELHNEPNLRLEGWGLSWQNGAGFATWATQAMNLYKSVLPHAGYMYPGLSPGGARDGERYDSQAFLAESQAFLNSCDSVGVHLYWTPNSPISNEVWWLDRHMGYNKPIWVTESSYKQNNNANGQTMATQYKQLVEVLKQRSLVQGVTFFVASASNQEFLEECWIRNRSSWGIAAAIRA